MDVNVPGMFQENSIWSCYLELPAMFDYRLQSKVAVNGCYSSLEFIDEQKLVKKTDIHRPTNLDMLVNNKRVRQYL